MWRLFLGPRNPLQIQQVWAQESATTLWISTGSGGSWEKDLELHPESHVSYMPVGHVTQKNNEISPQNPNVNLKCHIYLGATAMTLAWNATFCIRVLFCSIPQKFVQRGICRITETVLYYSQYQYAKSNFKNCWKIRFYAKDLDHLNSSYTGHSERVWNNIDDLPETFLH